MIHWFSFKNKDSRDFGIRLAEVPPIQRGRERVTQVTIPGRAGTLTLTEGDESFEPYTQGLAFTVPEENVPLVLSWLKGDGWLTISNDPDRRQMARAVNAVSFKRKSWKLIRSTVTVQLICQPLKEQLHPGEYMIESGIRIANTGDVPERPVFTLRGSGDITLAAGGNTLTLSGIEGGCIVDCAMYEVLTLDGKTIITGKSSGDFPYLPVGISPVTFTGADSAQIKRAVRYL